MRRLSRKTAARFFRQKLGLGIKMQVCLLECSDCGRQGKKRLRDEKKACSIDELCPTCSGRVYVKDIQTFSISSNFPLESSIIWDTSYLKDRAPLSPTASNYISILSSRAREKGYAVTTGFEEVGRHFDLYAQKSGVKGRYYAGPFNEIYAFYVRPREEVGVGVADELLSYFKDATNNIAKRMKPSLYNNACVIITSLSGFRNELVDYVTTRTWFLADTTHTIEVDAVLLDFNRSKAYFTGERTWKGKIPNLFSRNNYRSIASLP